SSGRRLESRRERGAGQGESSGAIGATTAHRPVDVALPPVANGQKQGKKEPSGLTAVHWGTAARKYRRFELVDQSEIAACSVFANVAAADERRPILSCPPIK